MVATIIPYIVLFIQEPQATTVVRTCLIFLMLWSCGGSPLVISFAIAKKVKHDTASLILLASTIVFGFWFLYNWHQAQDRSVCMSGLWLLYIAPWSLFFMLPAWITAYVLNRRYAKQSIGSYTEQRK